MAPARIDPILPVTPNLPRGVDNHLKDRLAFLAKGDQTVHQLMLLAKDLLRSAWDEFTFENIEELEGWLAGRIKADRAVARIRWIIIRDVFVSIRTLN